MPEFITRYVLTSCDFKSIKHLIRGLTKEFDSAEDSRFVHRAQLMAQELPRNLRSFLTNFRAKKDPSSAIIISGCPVDDILIGPTPTSWHDQLCPSPSISEEMLLMLVGSLLGQPFGFATQQNGHLIHNVLPMREHENDQLGCGSLQRLEWHTEDAFHPFKADYLALMCLRNPDHVPTHFASIDMINIPVGYRERLFKPHFVIRPDNSHLSKNNSSIVDDPRRKHSFRKVMKLGYRKVPILFGGLDTPFLQIDPYFMDRPKDPKDSESLTFLIEALEDTLVDIVLEAGDILILDNYKSVHGRAPFRPKYNGADRWLKRINITCDIRKSRSMRASCDSWVLI